MGQETHLFCWRRAVSLIGGIRTASVSMAELIQLPLNGATMYRAVFQFVGNRASTFCIYTVCDTDNLHFLQTFHVGNPRVADLQSAFVHAAIVS